MKFKTNPMDKEWKERLGKKVEGMMSRYPELIPLRERLLSYGGEEVCISFYEEDLERILSRGVIRKGTSKLMRGEPSNCHSNSARLWKANQNKVSIWTGYALSKDGVWRQHSWCVGDKLYETTEKRVAYYGFELTEEEAEDFYDENY